MMLYFKLLLFAFYTKFSWFTGLVFANINNIVFIIFTYLHVNMIKRFFFAWRSYPKAKAPLSPPILNGKPCYQLGLPSQLLIMTNTHYSVNLSMTDQGTLTWSRLGTAHVITQSLPLTRIIHYSSVSQWQLKLHYTSHFFSLITIPLSIHPRALPHSSITQFIPTPPFLILSIFTHPIFYSFTLYLTHPITLHSNLLSYSCQFPASLFQFLPCIHSKERRGPVISNSEIRLYSRVILAWARSKTMYSTNVDSIIEKHVWPV